jgi:hypothetical protein
MFCSIGKKEESQCPSRLWSPQFPPARLAPSGPRPVERGSDNPLPSGRLCMDQWLPRTERLLFRRVAHTPRVLRSVPVMGQQHGNRCDRWAGFPKTWKLPPWLPTTGHAEPTAPNARSRLWGNRGPVARLEPRYGCPQELLPAQLRSPRRGGLCLPSAFGGLLIAHSKYPLLPPPCLC